MDFKQLQWGYFLSILCFFLVFLVSKEISNYTTRKEISNNFLSFVCFSEDSLPVVSTILIIIDYIFLFTMITLNFVSLFLPENYALLLMLICNSSFLLLSCVAGGILHRIKKQENNI